MIMTGASAYFPQTASKVSFYKDKEIELTFISNLKNYDDEIEKFLNWIKPYIVSGSGINDFYAIVCNAESTKPEIYYL